MADSRYTIDWEPPSLAPGVSLLASVVNANRENARAERNSEIQAQYARAKLERESHQELRDQQAEKDRQDMLRHQRDIEARSAFGQVTREAHGNPDYANFLGSPYGLKFDQTTDLAPDQEGPEVTPSLEAARHPLGPLGAAAAGTNTPEVPETTGDAPQGGRDIVPPSPQSGTHELDSGEEGPVYQRPSFKAEEPIAISADAPVPMVMNKRLWATVNGQRFEVPETKETTGFGEKYDAIYKRYLEEPGVTPAQAFKAVMAEKEKDDAETGRMTRAANVITGRNEHDEKFRPDVETQKQMLADRLSTSRRNADVMAHSRVAAAAPEIKADVANARDMALLRQQGAAIRSTAQFAKLAQADQTVRSLMLNIANNAEPLQHRDAQIQLARFFRQAQPTEGEMHLLYNSLGGTMDKWNQFVARIENGDLSAEQLRQLQAAAHQVQHEHQTNLDRFVKVSRNMLGPGSGFDNMPDQAEQLYRGMGAELGLDSLPPLYETQGGVTLGSGHRPTTAPKPHPQSTSPHPSKEAVGATKKIGTKTYRKVGPNDWQEVAP